MALYDIVIHSGRLIDGTGNPWFYGDLGVKDGRIAAIGKINAASGARAISANQYPYTATQHPRRRLFPRWVQNAPASETIPPTKIPSSIPRGSSTF